MPGIEPNTIYGYVDDAIRLAMRHKYGLAGSIWRTDIGQVLTVTKDTRTRLGLDQYNADDELKAIRIQTGRCEADATRDPNYRPPQPLPI